MVLHKSFADLMVTEKSKGANRLSRIHDLVRWDRLAYRLKKILARSGLGPTGYNPLQLFQVLILQNLYGLSDPEMEDMLYDRISFRRFCGFGLSDTIPDETTICRFRGGLHGHTDKLFALVMEDITMNGIQLKSGTIIDATVIESSVRPPKGGEVSEADPAAGWTKKKDRYIYGYKAHVSCDAQTGLIKQAIATSADIHDSHVLSALLSEDDTDVYADKAYGSKKNRKMLRDHGIGDRLMYKAQRGKKQPGWQVLLNKLWGRTRCSVERIFGHWKTMMGIKKARYKGWEKNQVHVDLISMAYNLLRCEKLLRRPTG